MSKKIKNMLSILFVAVLTVSAFCIPASAAEDDLTISISTDEKDSVTAKVGDTVKYAIYMTDTKEEVIGAAKIGQQKHVDPNGELVKAAKAIGVSFGDE